ncbi:PPC domain-containing DNA-binding protein [Desulfurivibrio sp. C05AmB]|uniref:PPC domain-containing DNA-binding protein n=1 Tax=Desulfurivibrio sp. C05AmB TaxID=3374371 RepID=UPI00376EE412
MGKLRHGSDLLTELTAIAVRRGIQLGRIEAIGAVRQARIGFYDQSGQKYRYCTFEQPMEITQLIGNVSLKDENAFIHAHITLADETGKCYGGHLAHGTEVFACEFILEAYDGPTFERSFDVETGLQLWSI